MDMFGLVAVGVTTFFFLGSALHAADLYSSVRPMPLGDIVLGCSGWFIATFSAIVVAVVFWRLAKKVHHAWALHVLMLPLALAALKLGSVMMLHAIGTPDFGDTIGGPTIQAMVLLPLAVFGYYLAVLHAGVKRWSAATKVR